MNPPRLRGLFVAGTDTGVGKTTLSVALLRAAHRIGVPLRPFKPVETGAEHHPADALRLLVASCDRDLPLTHVCPYPLSAPVAPSVAATLAGRPLSLDLLEHAARTAASTHPLLVEAAGGLLTPYTPTETAADFAARLGLPILLVARNALGTINHTALAVSEIRRRALPLAGIVLMTTTASPTPDRPYNAEAIFDLTGVQPLGTMPFVPTDDPDALANAASAALPVAHLLAVACGSPAPPL